MRGPHAHGVLLCVRAPPGIPHACAGRPAGNGADAKTLHDPRDAAPCMIVHRIPHNAFIPNKLISRMRMHDEYIVRGNTCTGQYARWGGYGRQHYAVRVTRPAIAPSPRPPRMLPYNIQYCRASNIYIVLAYNIQYTIAAATTIYICRRRANNIGAAMPAPRGVRRGQMMSMQCALVHYLLTPHEPSV